MIYAITKNGTTVIIPSLSMAFGVSYTNCSIHISSPITTTGLTIPIGSEVVIEKDGSITTSGPLIINGCILGNTDHIFTSGEGSITYGALTGKGKINVLDLKENTIPGVTDMTSAFVTAYQLGRAVYAPAGVYAITGLVIDSIPLTLIGDGSGLTVIKVIGANVGLAIGTSVGTTGCVLKDFTLQGDGTGIAVSGVNIGGIVLGSDDLDYNNGTAAIHTLIEGVIVANFDKAQAYGLKLNFSIENSIVDCQFNNNFWNIYRQNVGFCGTTVFSGGSSMIQKSLQEGVYLNGAVSSITFENVIIESNTREGILYSQTAPGTYLKDTNIFIKDCWFEANLSMSANIATAGQISITGGASASYLAAKVVIIDTYFAAPSGFDPALDHKQIYMDGVANSIVWGNIGIFYDTNSVTTTDDCQIDFQYNGQNGSATDIITGYRSLAGKITVQDYSQGVTSYKKGDLNHDNLHIASFQVTIPNIAAQAGAGVGAVAGIIAGATDLCGRITLDTGTSGFASGNQVQCVFLRDYGTKTPTIQLSPTNSFSASMMVSKQIFAYCPTSASFMVAFGVAPGAGEEYSFNYLIVS